MQIWKTLSAFILVVATAFPQVPKVPSVPSVPSAPSMPSVPSIPNKPVSKQQPAAPAPDSSASDKPFTQQQVMDLVKAGLGNDAGAKLILQRGIDFEPTAGFIKRLKSAGAKDSFFKALRANAPISQEEVNHMLKAGLGEDTGAQMITQRGIDFTPTEAYIQTLKTGGAKDVFLKAVRDRMPVNQIQIVAQLAADTPSSSVMALVKDRGLNFAAKDDYLQEVHLAGGDDALVAAVKGAKVKAPANIDPAVQAKQDQVAQNVAHGAELKLKGQYADAEKEFHSALTAGAPDADVYLALASVEGQQRKWDDEVTAAREALKLNPNDANVYSNRSGAWIGKGEYDKAIADCNLALALNPKSTDAYGNRGNAWGNKGEYDKAIADYNQALAINPKDASTYGNRGVIWTNKREYDKAIADYNQALAINPKHAKAYNNLGALYATCPDEKCRDGQKAVENASKACELGGGKHWNYLVTLAAAYAESGDFDKAKECEAKVIEMAPDENSKQALRFRLELYKQGKPFHQGTEHSAESHLVPMFRAE